MCGLRNKTTRKHRVSSKCVDIASKTQRSPHQNTLRTASKPTTLDIMIAAMIKSHAEIKEVHQSSWHAMNVRLITEQLAVQYGTESGSLRSWARCFATLHISRLIAVPVESL